MRRIPARLIIFVVPRTGTTDRMAEHTAVCTGPNTNTNTNRGGQAPHVWNTTQAPPSTRDFFILILFNLIFYK